MSTKTGWSLEVPAASGVAPRDEQGGPPSFTPAAVSTLTFDDGPSEWSAAILDLLAEHGEQATFFVTGQAILNHVPVLKRMSIEGHTIGNHGYTHRRLTSLDDHEVRMELAGTQKLVELAVGLTPTLFRAPYFAADDRVRGIAGELGLTHVGASVIPDDWMSVDPVALAAVVLDELRPGAVVSLHDGVPPDGGSEKCTQDRLVTVDAVRLILEGMRG